ncbi:MAG: branched chain amino acid aminotransferase, partial [Bacillota bacterium]
LGYEVEERRISIDEVIQGIEAGTLTESFGSGTAAVISPVGSLNFKGRDYLVNQNKVGAVTQELYNKLVDIQYGNVPDPFGWVKTIGRI